MNDLFKKILKAIIGVVLPLIIDEIKKLIYAWLSCAAPAAELRSGPSAGLLNYLSSEEFAHALAAKIDNLL